MVSTVEFFVEDLVCPTIIGVGPQERLEKQDVVVNFKIQNAVEAMVIDPPDLRDLVKQVFEMVQDSTYLTLEALSSAIAKDILMILAYGKTPVKVTVSASKPHALPLAKSSEVVITRTLEDYEHLHHVDHRTVPRTMTVAPSTVHKVVLALGSNLGDRFKNIESALRLLEIPGEVLKEHKPVDGDKAEAMKVDVVDTSFLYETAPMYFTDQPAFINGACVIETNLSPLTLLLLVKTIETIVGRVPSVRNGPRAVDLDIILYDNDVFDTRPVEDRKDLDNLEGQLVIPHPRLAEREFVLRPLNDIVPDLVHPVLKKSIARLLQDLHISPSDPPMEKVIPFPRLPPRQDTAFAYPIEQVPDTLTHWKYGKAGTKVMATLNTTPDSFSDGSTHNVLPAAISYVKDSVTAGARIIDIGGYSTRPGAAFVSVDEETNRVVPYVQAIREQNGQDQVADIPISVDTFRWEVAEAALAAGANCINDVYSFTGPDSYPHSEKNNQEAEGIMTKMKAIARRGDAGQNKDYKVYEYAGPNEAVLEGVRVELGEKVEKIVKGKGGVRRWSVIVDPGIGFSKTLDGNLEVLRHASQVVDAPFIGPEGNKMNPLYGFPQLIGVSRKSFLGAILAEGQHGRKTTPKERVFATAAAVSCAVQQVRFSLHKMVCPPQELQSAHTLCGARDPPPEYVEAISARLRYNSRNCCNGQYNTAATCPASENACPHSYAYAYDEGSSTALFTCPGIRRADYTVTFCP
ncbi:folic acid synthesis protein [Coprinopsis cinerea okayama7|uniref:Folic acid synthesis protein n=1 Tax=Coprinopsis cinerea (strain Okayama-7 / 130 / ATCC MYA-4618 / FGSC 9003) TaxID=240176 RepID=D6RN59_COPC7|nr:folic acid synthesis protein [Coprinopsis cinerea okayama7\|eukprot:XP_002911014.1 folic acid synthesis protein [Coprinopsis cinerea okayama7\